MRARGLLLPLVVAAGVAACCGQRKADAPATGLPGDAAGIRTVTLVDAASLLSRNEAGVPNSTDCELFVDGKSVWEERVGGVVVQPDLRVVQVPLLPAGEHRIALRVGNRSFETKVVMEVPREGHWYHLFCNPARGIELRLVEGSIGE